MEYNSFFNLTQEYVSKIEENRDLQISDYVNLVRIWNTIDVYKLENRDSLFKKFNQLFFPRLVESSAQALEALPDKGMAYYSKKHDLYIGGKQHRNSHFTLTF